MDKYLLVGLLVVSQPLLAETNTSIFSFDDNREGLLFSAGAGLHKQKKWDYYEYGNSSSGANNGGVTTFKFGYGLTDQLSIQYINNTIFYTQASIAHANGANYREGLSGVGATLYYSSAAPSLYITAAAGIGSRSFSVDKQTVIDEGKAFMCGIGYEFNKHIQFELSYIKNDIDYNEGDFQNVTIAPEEYFNDGGYYKSSTIQFTVNYLWY